jgi:LysM repeat protein
MTAGRIDRGPVRIKRRGRHTTPSQIEKVAQQAGRAAPAVAIAGALVAAPQASHALAASPKPATTASQGYTATAATTGVVTKPRAAQVTAATLDSFATRAVTVAATKPARHAAVAQNTHYIVRSGDNLSMIAERYYHNADDWQYLYHENDSMISDPDLIYVGQDLLIPSTVPADFALTNYVPKHAAPTQAAPAQPATPTQPATTVSEANENSGTQTGSGRAVDVFQSDSQGTYSCSGLEQIWEQAGGNPADAFMAAEIAMAESGGNANAISPTADYGLWQINASNGSLATLNPFQNAQSAVALSDNGINWGPWTTYTSGEYYGKC